MIREDLEALVPGMVARHPLCAWRISESSTTTKFVMDVHLCSDPSRRAEVAAQEGWEIFTNLILGHLDIDFAYNDKDRIDALAGRLERAAWALTGPTHFTFTYAGGALVRSSMDIDAEESESNPHQSAYHWGRRVRGLLRGHIITGTAELDWPRLDPPPAVDTAHL
ncbi:hypothetical protein [Allobranchiibius sp. GilTou38]|uniref:hypothetical protein n=1 Tax=Allobranchiibius sp. GilTou38 TaxID=2815210 RepID=UPI001AA0E42B|nr:hypothetical protein [Allobranchiibius sp. GilTou38]MBO1768376.1 hypothetical protein [Allobranchiibius sp. GilTou38]